MLTLKLPHPAQIAVVLALLLYAATLPAQAQLPSDPVYLASNGCVKSTLESAPATAATGQISLSGVAVGVAMWYQTCSGTDPRTPYPYKAALLIQLTPPPQTAVSSRALFSANTGFQQNGVLQSAVLHGPNGTFPNFDAPITLFAKPALGSQFFNPELPTTFVVEGEIKASLTTAPVIVPLKRELTSGIFNFEGEVQAMTVTHGVTTSFLTWYTFSDDNKPLWLVCSAATWTSQGSSGSLSCSLSRVTSSGVAPLSGKVLPEQITIAKAGTATLVFTSTDTGVATIELTDTGLADAKPILLSKKLVRFNP